MRWYLGVVRKFYFQFYSLQVNHFMAGARLSRNVVFAIIYWIISAKFIYTDRNQLHISFKIVVGKCIWNSYLRKNNWILKTKHKQQQQQQFKKIAYLQISARCSINKNNVEQQWRDVDVADADADNRRMKRVHFKFLYHNNILSKCALAA